MELYFLRHGIAEGDAPTDAERRLTEEGRRKCRTASAGLERLCDSFDIVWSSPLIRARETAELMAPRDTIELRDVLANTPVEELVEALRELPERANVLLVGHEPQMSRAVAHLLGIPAGGGEVEMKKAGLAQLTVDLHRWPTAPATLRTLLTAKQLRWLGGSED